MNEQLISVSSEKKSHNDTSRWQPTGTLTFLFTDVQGSTQLWEQYPDQMRVAMTRHDELIEVAVEQQGGQLVRPRGEGDSRFAIFARASDAFQAAIAIQNARLYESLEAKIKEVAEKTETIKFFAYSALHDLKSPLIGIHGLSRRLHQQYRELLDRQAVESFEMEEHFIRAGLSVLGPPNGMD